MAASLAGVVGMAAAPFATRAAAKVCQSFRAVPRGLQHFGKAPADCAAGSLRSAHAAVPSALGRRSAPLTAPQLRGLAVNAYKPETQMQDPAAGRKFADFTVYKGKGAMCLKVIKPTWEVSSNGMQSISRAGVILLEFAAGGGGQGGQAGYGSRSYDWSAKQSLALNAAELGNILASQPNADVQIYHDPNKGTAQEGQTSKQLKIQPSPDGKGGYMFNFQVKDGNIPSGQFFIVVPVTAGEMVVIKSIANYALPRLLGFDELFNGRETIY